MCAGSTFKQKQVYFTDDLQLVGLSTVSFYGQNNSFQVQKFA